MNIKNKQFRNIIPLVSFDNHFQDYLKKHDIFRDIYFYDKYAIFYTESVSQSKIINNFKNRISHKKDEPKKSEIKKENSMYSQYFIDSNHISIIWEPYIKGEKNIMEFKGEILLEGDAIQGTIYQNGIPIFPKRIYYNINKPLPNKLIENEKFLTSNFLQNREFRNKKPLKNFGKLNLKNNKSKAYIYITLLKKNRLIFTYVWKYQKNLNDYFDNNFNNSWPYNSDRPVDNGIYIPVLYYDIEDNKIMVYNKSKKIIFKGSLSKKRHIINGYFYHGNNISKERIMFYDVDKQLNKI